MTLTSRLTTHTVRGMAPLFAELAETSAGVCGIERSLKRHIPADVLLSPHALPKNNRTGRMGNSLLPCGVVAAQPPLERQGRVQVPSGITFTPGCGATLMNALILVGVHLGDSLLELSPCSGPGANLHPVPSAGRKRERKRKGILLTERAELPRLSRGGVHCFHA